MKAASLPVELHQPKNADVCAAACTHTCFVAEQICFKVGAMLAKLDI